MIRKLYIITNAGVCFQYLDFLQIQSKKEAPALDPNLASGFFMAIIVFGENTIENSGNTKESVNYLAFKNLNYYFSRRNKFIFILETDNVNKNIEKKDIDELIAGIANTFEEYIKNGVFDPESPIYTVNETFETQIRDLIAKLTRKALFRKST
jgi:hypothetical protein